jgi:hypothetical protein
VGTVQEQGVKFRVYPKDHEGSATPHVHAKFGQGEVIIALLNDGTVALSEEHGSSTAGTVKKNEIRKALRVAREAYAALAAEWKKMHPDV